MRCFDTDILLTILGNMENLSSFSKNWMEVGTTKAFANKFCPHSGQTPAVTMRMTEINKPGIYCYHTATKFETTSSDYRYEFSLVSINILQQISQNKEQLS